MGSLAQIAPGLRRWTAWHPEWHEEVASLAVETADGLVLIDPLAPPAELGAPEHVLLTVYWHGRAAGPSGARRVWASRRSVRPLRTREVAVSDPFRAGDALPGGIQALQTARAAEVVYWLPQQRAVVAGDVLLGAGAKPRAGRDALRLCPERWLGRATHADLRATLQPLLALPVERVLVSHGEPVLAGGAEALADLLGEASRSP
jgi:glyoxylase-like metal-dependent hydrolase (beta-lactamase superfamily II)